MSTIKWGQRCIARRFEAGNGVAMWLPKKDEFIGKECVVYLTHQDGSVSVAFDDESTTAIWLPSALEPIPKTPNVWWPKFGEKVMHEGNVKQITSISPMTHQLDGDEWVGITQISPVTTTEITPEEAVKLLEQHTGKSFTIKSK